MANKIFRQVLCSERLPKEDGFYDTDFGICSFDGERFWQQCTMIGADWWLEEVELPNIFKMHNLADTTYPKNAFEDEGKQRDYDLKRHGFKNGFNKAIELIKGEGLNNG